MEQTFTYRQITPTIDTKIEKSLRYKTWKSRFTEWWQTLHRDERSWGLFTMVRTVGRKMRSVGLRLEWHLSLVDLAVQCHSYKVPSVILKWGLVWIRTLYSTSNFKNIWLHFFILLLFIWYNDYTIKKRVVILKILFGFT